MTTQRVAQGNEAMAVERWETESICSSCCWLTITASCQRPRQTEVLVFIKSGIQMKVLFGQSPARWISFRFWRLQRFKIAQRNLYGQRISFINVHKPNPSHRSAQIWDSFTSKQKSTSVTSDLQAVQGSVCFSLPVKLRVVSFFQV